VIAPLFESFSVIFDVYGDMLEQIKKVMQGKTIDLTQLPFTDLLTSKRKQDNSEKQQALFILSRPFFLSLNDASHVDFMFWQEGRCPICNSRATVSSLMEEGRRQMFCAFCGYTGYFKRIGCPVCFETDTSKIEILSVEGEDGYGIELCESCHSYVKRLEFTPMKDLGVELADLVSLPLDIIAQNSGFNRPSPNPIGLLELT
jgi:FdhE protein